MKVICAVVLISTLWLGISPPTICVKSSAHQRQDAAGEQMKLSAAEIAALVTECGERTTSMTRRLLSYSYIETASEYEVDKRGQVTREHSKVYEVSPVQIGKRSYIPHVQIAEDGVAFSAERVARERERIVKELTQTEADAARGQEPKRTWPAEYQPKYGSLGIRVEKRWNRGMSRLVFFINSTDFLRSHEFYAPERLVFNSRETILLKFRSRAEYVFDRTNVPFSDGIKDYGLLMGQLGGVVWIDATDKVIVRLEARPMSELGGNGTAAKKASSSDAAMGFEFMRLPNSTWVPSRSWYNSYGREDVFMKTAASRALKFSDFKLFKTSAEVEKLEPSREKPQ